MTTSVGTGRLGRAASATALGLVLLATCVQTSARAADDEDNSPSIWNLDQRLWNGFMSAMGLRNGTEVGIDYRERSPLVVPPQNTLPPPETTPARNAAWPVDPESKRRQEAAKTKPRSVRGWDPDFEGRNLSPSELGPRGAPRATASTQSNAGNGNIGDAVPPSQLGYFGGLFSSAGFGFGLLKSDTEVGTFTSEPPRTSLTAPPAGYQTPSPAQPYGVTKRIEAAKPDKIEDWGWK